MEEKFVGNEQLENFLSTVRRLTAEGEMFRSCMVDCVELWNPTRFARTVGVDKTLRSVFADSFAKPIRVRVEINDLSLLLDVELIGRLEEAGLWFNDTPAKE